jgi:apolipoprotein N-acyltransferase
VLVTGFLSQWLLSAIAFYWILPASQRFFELSLVAAVVSWLGVASVTNAHIPMVGWLWWGAHRRYRLGAVASSALLASAWVGLSGFHPTVVPFDYGYPWLWSGLPVLHLADWVGFRGLAWVTLFVNALLAFAWCAPSGRSRLRLMASALGCLAALSGIGWLHGTGWSDGERSLRMALVQPVIAPALDPEARELPGQIERARELLRLSVEAHSRAPADVWIWPESSVIVPLGAGENVGYQRWLSNTLATRAVNVLVGTHWSPDGYTVFNSAALFDRQGALRSVVHKERLFPFGEYMPTFGGLVSSRRRYATPQAGEQSLVIDVDGVRVGPTICFEGLFPDLFRRRADAGAQILVNLSNDAAFGNTVERYQHLYMTLARAIELRLPVVRATMSGVSAVITRTGEVIAWAPQEQIWARTVSVPYTATAQPTVYQRAGHLFEPLCLVVFGLTLLLLERRRLRPAGAVASHSPSEGSAGRPPVDVAAA